MKKEKIITFTLKPGDQPNRAYTDWERLNAMTDEEIEANALADEDNPPLTPEQLAKFKPVKPIKQVDVKAIREKLGLSQAKFADYFGISVRTLQQWEQGRQQPNRTARNFLIVAAKEPQAVQRALGDQR